MQDSPKPTKNLAHQWKNFKINRKIYQKPVQNFELIVENEEIWSAYTFSFFPAAKPVVKCQGLVITYVEIKYTTVCHQHSCGNEVYAVG